VHGWGGCSVDRAGDRIERPRDLGSGIERLGILHEPPAQDVVGYLMGHADRHFRLQACQIGKPVGQVEVEIDSRIETRKAAQLGGEESPHDREGQTHLHLTAEVGVTSRDIPLRLEQLVFDPFRRLKQIVARLGRDEPVPRPIEQLGAKAGFQCLQAAIHRRVVETQRTRRPAQGSRPQDREKDAQVVPVNG
jgi:hypothetical protein